MTDLLVFNSPAEQLELEGKTGTLREVLTRLFDDIDLRVRVGSQGQS